MFEKRCYGITEFAGREIAGLENDGRSRRVENNGLDNDSNERLEFGGLRIEGLKIFQFCKSQSPVTDCDVLHRIRILTRATFILFYCV